MNTIMSIPKNIHNLIKREIWRKKLQKLLAYSLRGAAILSLALSTSLALYQMGFTSLSSFQYLAIFGFSALVLLLLTALLYPYPTEKIALQLDRTYRTSERLSIAIELIKSGKNSPFAQAAILDGENIARELLQKKSKISIRNSLKPGLREFLFSLAIWALLPLVHPLQFDSSAATDVKAAPRQPATDVKSQLPPEILELIKKVANSTPKDPDVKKLNRELRELKREILAGRLDRRELLKKLAHLKHRLNNLTQREEKNRRELYQKYRELLQNMKGEPLLRPLRRTLTQLRPKETGKKFQKLTETLQKRRLKRRRREKLSNFFKKLGQMMPRKVRNNLKKLSRQLKRRGKLSPDKKNSLRKVRRELERTVQKLRRHREIQQIQRQLENLRDLVRQSKPQNRQRVRQLVRFLRRAKGVGRTPQPHPQNSPSDNSRKNFKNRPADGRYPSQPQPGRSTGAGGERRGSGRRPGTQKERGNPSGRRKGYGLQKGGEPLGEESHSDIAQDYREDFLRGKKGRGPTKREVIQFSGKSGFVTRSYRKVFRAYYQLSEEVLERSAIPPAYKKVIQRYFRLIAPN